MTEPKPRSDDETAGEFETAAGEPDPGFVRELLDFLRDNKKWWLLPILVVLALVAILAIFGGTAAAPFIYTLF